MTALDVLRRAGIAPNGAVALPPHLRRLADEILRKV
jgi:hypothetical protein